MNCKALAVRKSGRTLKTLLTAIVVFASMITGMAQVPSYVSSNGLVGWWPFNGNANDESGNGNNGTVGSGVTLSLDRFMGNNAAYDFNGSGNISLTSPPTIGSQNFTISGWVKTTNTSVRKGIACWGQDQPWQSTYFFITSSGYLKFDFAYNGGPQSSTFIADNNWHFVAVTCNSGLIQLFLDGQINGSPLQMNPNINGTNNALGANIDNSGSNNFVGSLDDIGIWNRALTQQEITNLYTASTPPPCNPLAANLQSGLVGYWPFCGNANDESGNGNNGTVNGATLTADRNGNANSAYSFQVNSQTEIDIQGLQLANDWTISLWYKPTNNNNPTQNYLLGLKCQSFWAGIGISNVNPQCGLPVNNNFIFDGSAGCANWVAAPQNYLTNAYNFLCVSYNNGIYGISINGSTTQYLNSLVDLDLNNLVVGRRCNDPSAYTFDGVIDDIGIWNRALTQSEITQLYTGNPCLNYQIITVTDTLIINANLSGINPVTFQNTIKVYPNPSSSQITIDFGANFNTLAGYTMRIQNAVGQTVYTTGVTQQQFTSNLNTWTGSGIYFVYLIDAQGNTVDVKKIILQ